MGFRAAEAPAGAPPRHRRRLVTDAKDLDLQPQEGGTRVRLRVKPGARRSAIVGAHGGALKIAVPAAPERGKANRSVLELLGEALGVPPTALRILSGAASRDKTVLVPLPPAEVAARLSAL